ncbi:hypothetical protein [Plantactinospora endophytica]|uniref:IclR-ED domain-containing protein n=1 Tax=Plantactinospora endophytica TaxID=673535 RepID=A0ABQ4EEA4_9ACTN|nr:hypothetical protein [Plantactinospora endophytica]GIG93053.1 hypothetical protein Pen02_79890 [Plantactinospora endophytica]
MIALRLARAAVMAAAGGVVTLAQLSLPSERFWGGQVPLQWASVLVLASYICYDAVLSVNYAVQAGRIQDYDNDIRAALSAMISTMVLSTGVSWDEVGVHYYHRRGVLHRRRLVRVGAIQAGAGITDTQRAFRPGFGIAGTAFSGQEIVAKEWRRFVRDATHQGREAWEERSVDDRFGLDWGQLRRSAQPEGIVASPTFAPDGRPNGCILVTGPFKEQDLTSDETRNALDDLATTLDILGPPPPGWWGAHER